MRKPNDMSRCLATLEQDSTLIAVIDNATSYCMPFSVRLFSMLQTRHFLGFPRVGRVFCMGWPALDANPDQQSVSLMRHTQRRERGLPINCIGNADLSFFSESFSDRAFRLATRAISS